MARRDRRDCNGERISPGDRVRVLGTPDLAGMAARPRAETARVFEHLVGTYRRVDSFDRFGFLRLMFRIRRGPLKGLHWVGIEPHLVRRAGGLASNRPLDRPGMNPARQNKRTSAGRSAPGR
jgi:hypothetical protein